MIIWMNIFQTNNFLMGLFIIFNYSIIFLLMIIWTMTNIPTAIFQMGIFQRLYCNRVYEMFMFRTGIFQRLYFKWLFETTIFQTVISQRLYFKRQCLSSLYTQTHSPYSAKSQSLRCCFLTSKWGDSIAWTSRPCQMMMTSLNSPLVHYIKLIRDTWLCIVHNGGLCTWPAIYSSR